MFEKNFSFGLPCVPSGKKQTAKSAKKTQSTQSTQSTQKKDYIITTLNTTFPYSLSLFLAIKGKAKDLVSNYTEYYIGHEGNGGSNADIINLFVINLFH